jgi:coenzyme PQQ synthesis protein D (PqqD)
MILRRNPQIEAAPLKDEMLLFNGNANKFFVMNVTAAFLWERLREPADVDALADALCTSFSGIAADRALADVRQAVKSMLDLGLLVDERVDAAGIQS